MCYNEAATQLNFPEHRVVLCKFVPPFFPYVRVRNCVAAMGVYRFGCARLRAHFFIFKEEKEMKKTIYLLLSLLLLSILTIALAACDEDAPSANSNICQHRDADDDALCDKCGES